VWQELGRLGHGVSVFQLASKDADAIREFRKARTAGVAPT
jgi:hypothetical protein